MESHPYCELFPPMTREEFADLFTDMAKNGQVEPITLYKGKILDGRNRGRACQELGKQPKVVEFEGDDEKALKFVIAKNLKRRNLSVSQKAMIGQASLKYFEAIAKERQRAAGGDKKSPAAKARKSIVENSPQAISETNQPKPKPAPKARDEAAKTAGVSNFQIQRAKKVVECSPELAKQVVNGEISINKALQKIAETDPQPAKLRGRPKFDPEKRWAEITVKLLGKEFAKWPKESVPALAAYLRKWADTIEKSL